MPNPYKQELPRKWNTWRDEDIYEFIAQTALNGVDDECETLIDAMLDELDNRDETHDLRMPDELDELDIPSYAS